MTRSPYAVQQLAPVVDELPDRFVVITVYTFSFQEGEARGAMKITYAPEADALYIYLIENPRECRVVRLTDDIALDFVEGDRLAGIDVLGASGSVSRRTDPRLS